MSNHFSRHGSGARRHDASLTLPWRITPDNAGRRRWGRKVGGDKQFAGVKPLFEPLSKAGFAWFSINYRLAPKHHFPAPVEDVESAIRWVKAHARQYRVDPQRIALTGESAGAHLVAMVAVQAKPDTQVAAVVPFYGPFDLEGLARSKSNERAAQAVLGLVGATQLNEEAYQLLRKASPMNYVHQGMPPFLLIHGTADTIVPHEQSVKLCEKIKSVGGACELLSVEGADHGIGGWEKHPQFQAYKSRLVEWLKATLDRQGDQGPVAYRTVRVRALPPPAINELPTQ